MTKHLLPVPQAVIAFLLLQFTACNAPAGNNRARTEEDSTENQMVIARGKSPMRLLSDRPYNLETPLHYFLEDFTRTDVFFVRWHLPVLPVAVSEDTFRLRVAGNVGKALALSMDDLRTKFKPVTIAALCQCAGNTRSCFKPRVAGAQWVNGGMGNAKWTGVRLKDILQMAGARGSTKFVSFNGLDVPALSTTPDFVKSLSFHHAMDEDVLIAYQMNGDTLPLLNGYPLKLIVPGWYATYWVGMLSDITVLADTFKGYWMDKAYTVPKGVKNGDERPDSLAKEMEPIGKMDVRSIFVAPEPGSVIKKGKLLEVQGLAFDGGDSITTVELSYDKGSTWNEARLGDWHGRYSWRRWHFSFSPQHPGEYELLVRATNAAGDTQPWHQWNRSGYMRNEIESITVKVAE